MIAVNEIDRIDKLVRFQDSSVSNVLAINLTSTHVWALLGFRSPLVFTLRIPDERSFSGEVIRRPRRVLVTRHHLCQNNGNCVRRRSTGWLITSHFPLVPFGGSTTVCIVEALMLTCKGKVANEKK